ncbi:MAG TPA: diguanylate cyclase [Solirubrobacteraceae bacterium]|nr:diguanylate cyclase [Solirubrobacteraceae bacterium]
MPSQARTLSAWLRHHAELLAMNPVERELGGRAGGILFLIAGLSAAAYPLLPGSIDAHPGWLYTVAVAAVVWSLVSMFVVDWTRISPFATYITTVAALGGIAVAMASTGGMRSSTWIYLFWVALFGCYFYARPVAMFFVAACIFTQALPLIYGSHVVRYGYLSQLILASAGYVTVGGCVSTGKRMVDRLRLRAEMLAAEQGALQRAASAVVRGEEAGQIFQLVSADLAELLGSSMTTISEIVAHDEATVLGSWSDGATRGFSIGEVLKLPPDGGFRRAIDTRAVVRSNTLPISSVARSRGSRSTLVAPILVEGEPWGVVSLASPDPHAFSRADEQRIEAFADMLARIVASLDERARLEAEALTDQLTGLPNHRSLHQRLVSELAAAARHGSQLSVAMIDVDNFKEINDRHGHARGDEALRFVADCMRKAVRASDTVGRLGGDEFMWILPDTDSGAAVKAVERARELIARGGKGADVATTSAGICDTNSTSDPAELVRRADVALYASKASGRNQVTLYDAEVAQTLDVEAREAWFERSQALAGLRALARAIDAKDPATSEHSERVAGFVALLAHADGWSEERIARLKEAALVHDVGKLAVPDALLTKPGTFTERERIQMSEHVELSARIVGSILSEEQVAWIRGHHERPDGLGYPAGLTEYEISDGAGLLALADAWDVMVAGRTYSRQKTVQEAYEECVELAGKQFMTGAVRVLTKLQQSGELALEHKPSVGEAGPVEPAATTIPR